MNSLVQHVLKWPPAYRLLQDVVGARHARRELIRTYIRPFAGARVLDIGCGTGCILEYLQGVTYQGFDGSWAYIDYARRRYGDKGQFFHRQVGDALTVADGSFDLVLALSVLYHLTDAEAVALFGMAKQVLTAGGRFVSMDPCLAAGQSGLARYVIQRDRGRYVRSESGYSVLASRAFGTVHCTITHNLLWFPYTQCIMEAQRTDIPCQRK